MEVIVEDMQSFSQIVTTNKLKTIFFTGRVPFLLPIQQHQSSEGNTSLSQITK